MVGVVILPRMRRQFGGQLHFVTQTTTEPEAAGQLAGVWHDRDEALLKEVISDVALLSMGGTSTIFNA